MAGRQFTSFEHILLGLICTAPSSGYDLKRIFAATPMSIYQPSSGALYPALRRLEQQGLVQAQSGRAGQSARHRRVYEPTQTGRAAHTSWLRTPVEPATVSRDLGLHLMRFVMMEHLLPPAEVLTFLQSLADALAAFTAQLEKYTAAADLPGSHPRLALDHGLAVHRASLRWAEHTIAALSAQRDDGSPGAQLKTASGSRALSRSGEDIWADTGMNRTVRTQECSPSKGSHHKINFYGRLHVIAYRATLDVPREPGAVHCEAAVAERHRRGTARSGRALTCFWEAVLGLRWFRDRTTPEALARDHGISRATAYRYVDEVIAVLADQAPDQDKADLAWRS